MKKYNIGKLFFSLLVICGLFLFPSNLVKADNANSEWLVVDSYSTSTGRMVAGEENTIQLNLKNTNSEHGFYNILLSFDVANADVLPVEGNTNQIYIDEIGPNETKMVEIPVEVAASTSGQRALTVSLKYFNIDGDRGHENSSLLLFDVQRSALNIEDVSVKSQNLSIKYTNASENDIYNAVVKVSGDVSSVVSYDIGNVSAGESATIDVPVEFISNGNQRVQVSFSYENVTGNAIQSDSMNFMLDVSTESKDESTDGDELDDSGSIEDVISSGMIFITCGIVILAVLVIRFFQKKSKK